MVEDEGRYSHLDFSETELGSMLYQDRKMLKYRGFILSEQTDQQKINEQLRELVERRELDEQEMQDIMFTLKDAKERNWSVRIEVFEKVNYKPKNIYDFTIYDNKGFLKAYEYLVPVFFNYLRQEVQFENPDERIRTFKFSDIMGAELM
ncbi:hypothetical protein [Listeria costaricensis]|uniref:hypothetical protein n=1 Tax=Listeria costaricensis TaxID=2026604 RepID=UPI000C06B111|nr:hypothetical protein [Listeria costaricensis]